MSTAQASSAGELGAIIAEAARDGTRVLTVGGGTHGGAAGGGRRVSLADRMRSIVGYDPADLVVTVDAGLSVEELDAALAAHDQEWCADIMPGSTVGGAIASGASSLRRFATGPLRDSVLGLELVDGRGRLIRIGGRTVKNSTGLDLVRFLVGSRGTLGVITRAHLRVRPRPRVRMVVRARDVDLGSAIAAARQTAVLTAAIADGSSVEFLLEGWRDDVASAAAALEARLGARSETGAEGGPAERPWARWPVVALLTVRPSALEMLTTQSGARWAALVSTGHLWVGGDAVSELIPVCGSAIKAGGHATLISEPGWPVWRADPADGDGAAVADRLQAVFDPDGVFPRLERWSPG